MSSSLPTIDTALSGGVSIILKLLGFQYPTRMASVFCAGCVLEGLAEAFGIAAGTELGYFFFFSLSYLLFFYPMWTRHLIKGKDAPLDETLEKVYASLDKTLRDGKIPPAERKIFYVQIAKHIVQQLNISTELREEMRRELQLAEQLSQEES